MIRGRRTVLLVLLPALLQPGSLRSETEAPTEYEVKAAFLYHFTRFVDWPSDALGGGDAPFVVGVLGADPFDRILDDAFAGKEVRHRRLEIRRADRLEDLGRLQILFISSSKHAQLPSILGQLGDGVLTVGETRDFAARGGMIGFIVIDNRVRFEINLEQARRARLAISSQLLKLAKLVHGEGE